MPHNWNPLLIMEVFAQDYIETDLGRIPTDPTGFATKIYEIGLGLVGLVALLFIIYGAYLVISSQGDVQKLNSGKNYIIYSIIGLILAVAGYAFYQFVAKGVLGIPGF